MNIYLKKKFKNKTTLKKKEPPYLLFIKNFNNHFKNQYRVQTSKATALKF